MKDQILTPRTLRSRSASLKARAAHVLPPPPPAKKRHSHFAPESAYGVFSNRAPLGVLPLPDVNAIRTEPHQCEHLPHSLPPARKAGAAQKTAVPPAKQDKGREVEESTEGGLKRKRKTSHQLKMLEAEFARNPRWSKKVVGAVSQKTGLSEAQVYKWHWDHKRRRETDLLPSIDEFGGYSKPGFSGFESITEALGINIDAKVRDLRLELESSSCRNGKTCKAHIKKYQKLESLVRSNKENYGPA